MENLTPQVSQSPTANEPTQDTNTPNSRFTRKTLIIIFAIVIAVPLSFYLTIKASKEITFTPQQPITVKEQVEKKYPIDEEVANWKEYTNKRYEFFLKYPGDAVFTEADYSEDEPSIFQAFYTKDKVTDIYSVSETNLKEGFLFKTTVIKNVELKTAMTSAEEKLKFFTLNCPATAQITAPARGVLSGFESASFRVSNCKGSYKITFVKRKTNMYEITQFAQGNLGYSEKYLATTEKMLNNMRLTNTIAPVPFEQWIPFGDKDKLKLMFNHPQMDDKCCEISGPIRLEGYETDQVVVLGMSGQNTIKGRAFNGFGLFEIENMPKEQLGEYILKQRSALIEEYRIVVGKNPEVVEQSLKVGGLDAIVLKNIAWWGDLVIVYSEANQKLFLFAKTEILRGEFESIFQDILTTVTFY